MTADSWKQITAYVGGFLHTLASLATHCGLEGQAGLHPSSDIGPYWFINSKGSDKEDGSGGVTRPLHARLALGHTSHWLERPIHRHTGDSAGPEASASLSLSWEQVTVHFWPATFTVLDDNGLQRAHTAEAMTKSHSIFYFAARHTRRYDHLLATSTQPTLDAFLESIGAVTRPPPPTGNKTADPNHW